MTRSQSSSTSNATLATALLTFTAATSIFDDLMPPGFSGGFSGGKAHAAAPQDPSSDKKDGPPFSKELTESLSHFHLEIRDSTFSQSLSQSAKSFGKTGLSIEQWKSHLVQRALVLREIEKGLDTNKDSELVQKLYGTVERESLKLLEEDLKALKDIKVSEDPLPETAAFLEYIRSISKKSDEPPMELLGISNVYLGGARGGGKIIATMAKIGLGTTSKHYSGTSGLIPYRKELDKVTDPEKQERMKVGARKAYEFLIALNNLEAFK